MSSINKIVTLSLIALLISACSNKDNRYKREVSGDESYLKTPELRELVVPAGMDVPKESNEFDVRNKNVQGAVGKQLDIRPPEQILTPIQNTIVAYRNGAAHVYFLSQKLAWNEVLQALKDENISYNLTKANELHTGKVVYSPLDEELPVTVSYIVSSYMVNQNQQALDVAVKEILLGDQIISENSYLQRYAVMMLNRISLRVAENRKRTVDSQKQAQYQTDLSGQISISTGMDETGLPRILIRSPYGAIYPVLPGIMAKVGIKVQSVSKNKGLLTVNYQGTSNAILQAAGIESSVLDKGMYQIQLGDLVNRTSLQFNYNNKSKFLNEKQNEQMAALIDYAFNHEKE